MTLFPQSRFVCKEEPGSHSETDDPVRVPKDVRRQPSRRVKVETALRV